MNIIHNGITLETETEATVNVVVEVKHVPKWAQYQLADYIRETGLTVEKRGDGHWRGADIVLASVATEKALEVLATQIHKICDDLVVEITSTPFRDAIHTGGLNFEQPTADLVTPSTWATAQRS